MLAAKLDASQVTAQYGAALRRLASLTGFDQKTVLLGEAGAILKTWAGRTKVRTQEKIDLASRLHVLRDQALTTAFEIGDITINAGLRGPEGRVWRKVGKGNNRKFLLIGQMLKDGRGVDWGIAAARRGRNQTAGKAVDWSKYSNTGGRINAYANKLPSALEKGRRAAGLARQSVVQIADALGIDLAAVPGSGLNAAGLAKARAALATNGRAYKNGTGTSLGDAEKATITLINRLPYGTAAKMDTVLLGVMAGRAKFFQQSYAKGAFDTIERTARAYPWMRVYFRSAA